MKVLLINSDDGTGGAARAAIRQLRGLRSLNVDTSLLVQKKHTDLESVIGPQPMLGYWQGELRPHLDALPVCLYPSRTGALFSPAALPGGMVRNVDALSPDIVHLHWICNGLVRLESLLKLKRPLVWTLHDSWAFTGGCHLPGECRRYQQTCGACPVLGSMRESDLSRKVWQRKKKIFAGLNLNIVTPSRWLADCANSSSLLKNKKIVVIHNGLDTEKFRPLNKRDARNILGLPQDVPLVLYCGTQATVDQNKGADLLLAALGSQAVRECKRFELVVFGTMASLGFEKLGVTTHYLGRMNDEVSIRIVYASADLLVLPSRSESLSYVVMESMACGTPCVSFDVGGVSDLIDHMFSGYLATPLDTHDLATGIVQLLDNRLLLKAMAERSRNKIVLGFDQETVASRYLDLYHSLIN